MTVLQFRRPLRQQGAAIVSKSPLSDEQIRATVPAVFAEQAHSSRSARYVHVPTHELLAKFRQEGFFPYSVQAARVRATADATRNGFQKHVIRFRHASAFDTTIARQVGDLVPEVVMINSHDGTSSYEEMGGIFRFVCANGLIVADSVVGAIRVHHSGKVLDNLIEGAFEIAAQAPLAVERANVMRSIELDSFERMSFARSALKLRWEEDESPIDPLSILNVRRWEDAGNDLWSVFNRAQEALIRSGQIYRHRNEKGEVTNRRVRPVNGIAQSVEINKGLWQLAENVISLKRAA